MAEQLDSKFDFSSSRSRASKYPYNEWADGSAWKATKGKDFRCSTASFRASLARFAERHGMSLETSVLREGKGNSASEALAFRFHKTGKAASK